MDAILGPDIFALKRLETLEKLVYRTAVPTPTLSGHNRPFVYTLPFSKR